MKYDIVIIGGGPSGLFAGCLFESKGQKVLLLEKKKSVGRKLLLSGAGQCNITHGGDIKEFLTHYGEKGKLLRRILYEGNNKNLMEFLKQKEVDLVERPDGKVFPRAMDANAILNALVQGCYQNNVEISTDSPVIDIKYSDVNKIFNIKTEQSMVTCSNLLIAGGGKSYPSTGSDGSLFPMIKELGIEVTPLKPALVPLIPQNYPYAGLSGLSFENCQITIQREEKKIISGFGDVLLTHKSLSGPGILNISRYVEPADVITINYLGNISLEKTIKLQNENYVNNPNIQVNRAVRELFSLPKRFVEEILKQSEIQESRKVKTLNKKEIIAISKKLTQDWFLIEKTEGYNQAMATSGGVSLDEIDLKTMGSKKIKRLYFIGEILDVDGDTGGYNLQFAFSSANMAVKSLSNPEKNLISLGKDDKM